MTGSGKTPAEGTTILERIPGMSGSFVKRGTGAHAERIHAHREHSISIVRNGATTVRVADHAFKLAAGEGVYIPPGVPHLCSPENPAAFAYEVLYWSDEANRELGVRPPPVALAAPVPSRTAENPERYAEMIELFLGRHERPPTWKLVSLASILSSEARVVSTGMGRDGTERYREYRRCRAHYGISPHDLEQNLKIERAKQRLADGMSVADTAADCGFCDQSHFVRSFKLYTGLTPTEFRKAYPSI